MGILTDFIEFFLEICQKKLAKRKNVSLFQLIEEIRTGVRALSLVRNQVETNVPVILAELKCRLMTSLVLEGLDLNAASARRKNHPCGTGKFNGGDMTADNK